VSEALALRGITRRFGPVVANKAVDFSATAGEVHALVGENGAGKSTLMRIAYGLIEPDSGEIAVKGEAIDVRRWSPSRAIARGVGMVHQHFMLVEPLTVAENVVLGAEPRRGPWIDRARACREIAEVAERFGLSIDPEARLEDLSVGEKQRVEILKVLWRGCEVLILDEPTAVLTPQEVAGFFAVLRDLVAAGMAVVLITHKLDEVLDIADRITVMRRGEVAAEIEADGASAEDIARAMVGRPVLLEVEKPVAKPGETALSLAGVSVRRARGDRALDGIDLELRAGEILGVAGVEGNGQRELIETIVGLRSLESGTVSIAGRDVAGVSVAARLASGLAHIPEDRHARGLVLDFSIAENLILGRQRDYATRRGIDRRRVAADAAQHIEDNDIRPADPEARTGGLSGGNQQKVVIARELARRDLRVLIAAQPTRGVDVGAIERIHRQIIAARDSGVAVLLLSAELSELRALSDRLIVLYKGRVAGALDGAELAAPEATERIGALMTGAASPGAAAGDAP
jgi:simple sugar transport system ATP-binding protein